MFGDSATREGEQPYPSYNGRPFICLADRDAVKEALAEKDRIIEALRAELVNRASYYEGHQWNSYKESDAYALIEQARSGK